MEWANGELLQKEDCEMEAEVALPEKQVKKKSCQESWQCEGV